jgi:hypothetical protein
MRNRTLCRSRPRINRAHSHPERGKLRAVQLTIPLRGPAGEPVDLWRTLVSHGVADLPPMRVDEDERTLTATLPLAGTKPRTVVVRERGKTADVDILGPRLGARGEANLRNTLRRVLNLDEDLSGFYEVAAADPDLPWAAQGAGRMLRSPTVFEEVVKTRCPLIRTSPSARSRG